MSVVAIDGSEMQRILSDGGIPLLIQTLASQKLLYSDQMLDDYRNTISEDNIYDLEAWTDGPGSAHVEMAPAVVESDRNNLFIDGGKRNAVFETEVITNSNKTEITRVKYGADGQPILKNPDAELFDTILGKDNICEH